MRKCPGAPPEAEEQSCLRWFSQGCAGWLARNSSQRQRLLDHLASPNFGEAFEEWKAAGIEDKPAGDLRQERYAFIEALSEAGERPISPSAFYDIVHDVQVFCQAPELLQENAEIRRGKKLAQAMQDRTRPLAEALAVEKPTLGIYDQTGQQRQANLIGLQALVGRSITRAAIRAGLHTRLGRTELRRALGEMLSREEPSEMVRWFLADLDRLLVRHIKGLEERFSLGGGSPPNLARQALLGGLSEIYEAAGGSLSATWPDDGAHPGSPFARFLTLIYVALPDDIRAFAGKTRKGNEASPSAFIKAAERVLADGKRLRGPMLCPVTDAEYRAAALEHRNRLLERGVISKRDRDE
jgi:hypothetical protein